MMKQERSTEDQSPQNFRQIKDERKMEREGGEGRQNVKNVKPAKEYGE